MLTSDDFGEFFAAVNGGHLPYPWQTRLVRHLVETGRWPEHVTAPTGSGKSAVVEVHVFANALSALGSGVKVPRRLAISVNRRGMVDHHHQRAEQIADLLTGATSGVLGEVSEALGMLRSVGSDGASPFRVVNLRGGVRPDAEWLEDPAACAVLAVTPDMWGSRILFSGYGSSRAARPREAGLLAMDAALVLDEAHLSRQLETTARQLARMAEFDGSVVGVPSLQVCAMSATPTGAQGASVDVAVDDLESSPELSRRLQARKPVTLVEASPGPGAKVPAAYLRTLVTAALEVAEEVREHGLPRTVGVVVNHVDTAARVSAMLAKQGHTVRTWVGRMRPLDLERARHENPGLFTIEGDDTVDFLVATMTVEVGVDLDLAGMVTELAPASALAQRFGRVNRRGLRPSAPVRVVAPAEVVKDRPPYTLHDLQKGLEWVRTLLTLEAGATPWALTQLPPPPEALRRLVLTRAAPAEIELLAHTSVVPFAEPELAFHLRDSLEPERAMAGIVMRGPLPPDDASATDLLTKTPHDPQEVFPVTVQTARTAAQTVLDGMTDGPHRVWRRRGDELTPLSLGDSVLPGDVLLMDPQPFVLSGVVVDPFVPDSRDVASLQTVWGPPGVEVRFAEEDSSVRDAWDAREGNDVDVEHELYWPAAVGANGPDWVVVKPAPRVEEDPEARQEWSTSTAVTLAAHSSAVADRAEFMAHRIGLSHELAAALRAAGEWHDTGKRDARFQREVLRQGPGEDLLAKSHGRGAQEHAWRRAASTLPTGWRHEQLSAAHTVAHYDGIEPLLVARLVGTSHGRGRPLFPHSAASLLDAVTEEATAAAARSLFTAGAGWSDVWEKTHAAWGVYGCAYLEAVLRSADCTVSKEGS